MMASTQPMAISSHPSGATQRVALLFRSERLPTLHRHREIKEDDVTSQSGTTVAFDWRMSLPSSLTRDFGEDHASLDLVLGEVLGALVTAPERAHKLYQDYNERLRGHMRVEDRLLFAPFERKTGLRPAGPTVTLTQTHRQISMRLDELTRAFSTHENGAVITGRIEQLRAMVKDQSVQEETVIFPSCQGILDPQDIERALAALRGLAALH